MTVSVVILGAALFVVGLLGVIFRGKLDDANIKHTPQWMKPPGGGGTFAPSQRSFRLKSAAVGMAILAATGLGLMIAGFVVG